MLIYPSPEFEKKLNDLAYDSRLNKELTVHGWDHTLRVAEFSKMIISSLNKHDYVDNTLIAAYFHDVGRVDDSRDIYHGHRSGEIIKEKIPYLYPKADIESIVFAFEHHSNAKAPNGGYPVIENYDVPDKIDPIISTVLWDADRLDLLRIKKVKYIVENYLNTDCAKQYANTPEHRKIYVDCKRFK